MEKYLKEINFSNLFTITSFVLGIMAFIVVLGILTGAGEAYYNFRVGAPMYFLLLTMLACLSLSSFGRKLSAYITLIVFFSSIIFLLISPFNNLFVDASFPLILVTLFASTYEIYRNSKKKGLLEKIKNISPHIIHIAVIITLTGILLTSVYSTSNTYTINQDNREFSFQEYNIRWNDYTEQDIGYGEVYNYEFDIYKNGNLQGETKITYVNKTNGGISSRPGIYSSLTEDLYLRVPGSGEAGLSIEAISNPYPILLWTGVVLLSLGITLRMITPLIKKTDKIKPEIGEEESLEEESFDERIEEELKRIREEEDT